MSEKTKAVAKTTKFKAGQWLVAEGKVFVRIVAVIDSGVGAMYFMYSSKPDLKNPYQWESQYQLDEDKFEVGTPDYAAAQKLKAGDILNLGSPEESNYATVLARVDDAVLLSQTPDKQKADMLLKLDDMMQKMGEEFGETYGGMDDDDRRKIKKMGSQLHASKAAGRWYDVNVIALMNWQILGDE